MRTRKAFPLALLLCLPLSLWADRTWLNSPHPNLPAVNQLQTDGNACGPACLLDAFRSGSEKWRQSITKIEGDSDTEKIKKIILTYGKRGSRLDPKKARWNGRYGMNGSDLADIANELRSERWMGTVTQKIFFKTAKKNHHALLKKTHKQLSHSLKKGLPPIVRVRRVALRTIPGTRQKDWLSVKGHFLVITGLPKTLPKNASSFPVTYHDPWGGKKLQGHIRTPNTEQLRLPTLVADFPHSTFGKTLLPRQEPSCLSLSSGIGLF